MKIEKYLEELRRAEFGSEEDEFDEGNNKEVVKLLKRARKWKTYKNLYDVCVYLGYNENDDDMDTIDALYSIIDDNIEAYSC